MRKCRIARPITAVESPAVRSLPLVEFLVDTKAELFELMVRPGLQVLGALLAIGREAGEATLWYDAEGSGIASLCVRTKGRITDLPLTAESPLMSAIVLKRF